MADKYHLQLSLKTKLFNTGRRLFMLPVFENWLTRRLKKNSEGFYSKLVPPDYLYKKGSWRNAIRYGLTYKLDISNVVDHYLYFRIIDRPFNKFMDTYIHPGSFVLDIGTNIGTVITRMAAKVGKQGFVFGFEPSPYNFQRAIDHVKMNGLTNCHIENAGLGNQPGVLKLYRVNEHNPGMNRILEEKEGMGNYAFDEVKVITLDSYLADKNIPGIQAVKIDVEGFEYYVVKGAVATFSRWKPVIFMEVNYDFLQDNKLSVAQLFELLRSCGYATFIAADSGKEIGESYFGPGVHIDIICKP